MGVGPSPVTFWFVKSSVKIQQMAHVMGGLSHKKGEMKRWRYLTTTIYIVGFW